MKSRDASWLIGLMISSGATPAMAHDFWLQPDQYWIEANTADSMTLQVGHGPLRQRSPIAVRRILRYEAISPQGERVDLRKQLQLGEPTRDGTFRLAGAGTHVLVLQTDDRAQSHLPAIRFNDYLQAEGLTLAVDQRARLRRTDEDGSERYSRGTKALVQVGGSNETPPSRAQIPSGLPLEIVPDVNPYSLPRPAVLPVRVLLEGRPLAGALVKLTDLDHDATPLETHLTGRDGRANFPMPRAGHWLVNVVWTRPLAPSEDVDFETFFSSLTFGFPP